jgi:hypothetical protein
VSRGGAGGCTVRNDKFFRFLFSIVKSKGNARKKRIAIKGNRPFFMNDYENNFNR